MQVDFSSLAAFFGIIGVAVTAVGYGRVRRKDETIEVYKGLVDAVKSEREELRTEVHVLKGRVDVLQSTWARGLASDIASQVVEKLRG